MRRLPYRDSVAQSATGVDCRAGAEAGATEEMKGWITNAKNCGWSSTSGGTKELNNLHIGDKVEGNWHIWVCIIRGLLLK